MNISNIDKNHYLKLRKNISDFIKQISEIDDVNLNVLDIAPEIHKGAKRIFS